MVNDLLSVMDSALKNPNSADLLANLDSEKANYNDIFNSLPKDRSRVLLID